MKTWNQAKKAEKKTQASALFTHNYQLMWLIHYGVFVLRISIIFRCGKARCTSMWLTNKWTILYSCWVVCLFTMVSRCQWKKGLSMTTRNREIRKKNHWQLSDRKVGATIDCSYGNSWKPYFDLLNTQHLYMLNLKRR